MLEGAAPTASEQVQAARQGAECQNGSLETPLPSSEKTHISAHHHRIHHAHTAHSTLVSALALGHPFSLLPEAHHHRIHHSKAAHSALSVSSV
jgi:hypothetical protein